MNESCSAWLEHVAKQALNSHAPDRLPEEQFFNSFRIHHPQGRQHQEKLPKANLLTGKVPPDVISQHDLCLVLIALHLLWISQSSELWFLGGKNFCQRGRNGWLKISVDGGRCKIIWKGCFNIWREGIPRYVVNLKKIHFHWPRGRLTDGLKQVWGVHLSYLA